MGKETRLHPVSLQSIRGAFRNCGFRIGKLTQVNLAVNQRTAWYRCQIVSWPNDLKPDKCAFNTLIGGLRSCFAADISVTSLVRNKQGEWWVDISTTLDPVPVEPEPLFVDIPGKQGAR
jgi:hypothetical protein